MRGEEAAQPGAVRAEDAQDRARLGLAQAAVGHMTQLPFMGLVLGNVGGLSVSPLVAAIVFGIAVGVGAAAGFVPAFGAYRARITDMLRPA